MVLEENVMNYIALVLILLTVKYLFNLVTNYLDWKSMKNPVPANVSDIFSAEEYQEWKSYHSEKVRLSILSSTFDYIFTVLAFAFCWHACFAGLFPENPVWGIFAILLCDNLIHLIEIPFTYYDKMKIEEKYGFNRSTKKTFWLDQVKSFFVDMVVLPLIGMLIMLIHQSLGDWMIPALAIALTCVILAVTFLYPMFSKFFNKFTELEDGELKEKLTALLSKNGYQVRAIQVMDASKRTTKMNAYFTGFGKMKTIVLYDTLKEALSVDEICAVFAHEMGHGLHKDTLKGKVITFVQMLILASLAWFTFRTPELFTGFGFDGINYGFAMVLIVSVEFAVIAPLFGLVANAFSRKAEYRADAQAVKEGYADALIGSFKIMAKSNYINLSPDPLLVKLQYSHPTISQRINAIETQRE